MFSGIRAVAGGDAVVAPSITRRLIDAFAERQPDPDGPSVREDARIAQLTAREREVVVEVARGRSNAEISQRLGVAPGTVKTHVARILSKLALRDRVHVVVFAYECGLVHPGD